MQKWTKGKMTPGKREVVWWEDGLENSRPWKRKKNWIPKKKLYIWGEKSYGYTFWVGGGKFWNYKYSNPKTKATNKILKFKLFEESVNSADWIFLIFLLFFNFSWNSKSISSSSSSSSTNLSVVVCSLLVVFVVFAVWGTVDVRSTVVVLVGEVEMLFSFWNAANFWDVPVNWQAGIRVLVVSFRTR